MKKRGRPPRDCAIEKTRHGNADIGRIEPEASREEGETSETLDSQCVPYGIASSGALQAEPARNWKPEDRPTTEEDITDEMVRVVTLALGGITPNAWGLTDPKRIIAAVCNAVGRGWR
jgi:hypothetical protein